MAFNVIDFLTGAWILNALFPPDDPAKQSISGKDIGAPTVKPEGEIPVIFGTVNIRDYLITWFGDTWADNSTGINKYGAGLQVALCMGPVDALVRIRANETQVWRGWLEGKDSVSYPSTDGWIFANHAFGGDSKEGGIVGQFEFRSGTATQEPSDYILGLVEEPELVPAYRRAASVTFRRPYIGTTPNLKPFEFLVERTLQQIDRTELGTASARIKSLGASGTISKMQIAIGLYNVTETRLAVQAIALTTALEFIRDVRLGEVDIDLRIFLFSGTTISSETTWLDADEADLDAAITLAGLWVSSPGTYDGTAAASDNPKYPWVTIAESLDDFWDDEETTSRIFIPVVHDDWTHSISQIGWEFDDSEEVATAIVHLEPFNIKVSPMQMKVVFDGEIVSGYNKEYYTLIAPYGVVDQGQYRLAEAFGDGAPLPLAANGMMMRAAVAARDPIIYDANPANIIKECLLDEHFGLGLPTDDVDTTSFSAAAVTLAAEGLGMSTVLREQAQIGSFLAEVLRHIDATLYINRRTGRFEIKLIRPGATPVVELDERYIESVDEYSLNSLGDLVNSVTVTYTDALTGETLNTTLQSLADIEIQGNVISATVDYPGFTSKRNATLAGLRDLQALGTPLVTCQVRAILDPDINLTPGDTFVLTWSEYELDQVVMRVQSIEYGDSISEAVRIKCVQDVFQINSTIDIPETSPPEIVLPTAAVNQIAYELPHWQLVQELGKSATDALLGDDIAAPTLNPGATPAPIKPNQDKFAAGRIAVVAEAPGKGYQPPTLYTGTSYGAAMTSKATAPHAPRGTIIRDNQYASTTVLGANSTTIRVQFSTSTYSAFQIKQLIHFGGFAMIEKPNAYVNLYGELVFVESAALVNATTVDFTIRRGMLDTVPKRRALDGDPLMFWLLTGHELRDPSNYTALQSERDANGNLTINTKVRTSKGGRQLPVQLATNFQHELGTPPEGVLWEVPQTGFAYETCARAYRPIPPGQVEIRYGSTWTDISVAGDTTPIACDADELVIRWKMRYRQDAIGVISPYGYVGDDVSPSNSNLASSTYVTISPAPYTGSWSIQMDEGEDTTGLVASVGTEMSYRIYSSIYLGEAVALNSWQYHQFTVVLTAP